MLRLRYLYAAPLPPALPPRLLSVAVPATESISRHLERVGNETQDFHLRRELLATSSRLAEVSVRESSAMPASW